MHILVFLGALLDAKLFPGCNVLITSAKEVMFLPEFVCLSVCLLAR